MQYDFTTLPARLGHDALAVDCPPAQPKDGYDIIPMWVADMNFPVAPPIRDAILGRLEHPTFGYFQPRADYYDAIIRWQETRNGVTDLTKEHIAFDNGVLGGVISALTAMRPHDNKILIHAPTYIGFTGALGNAGYTLIHSHLKQDEAGVWRMDLADMEEKILAHGITAAVFCSPHNPTGRVWEAWELEAAMALYEKYNIAVVSDEIWSDLTLGDHKHIPTQSVSAYAREHTAAMYAPTKTFNLAGLTGSYHIIYNKDLFDAVAAAASHSHYNNMHVLSMYALIGAYSDAGAAWCDELREVLAGNVRFAVDYIRTHFDGVSVFEAEGTYMLFPDCTGWCEKTGRTIDELLRAAWDVGVMIQDGRPFHGTCHLRINLALPRARVEEAFRRLDTYVFHA